MDLKQIIEQAQKEYKDFYFETGKYSKRKQGFDVCAEFLFSQIDKAVVEVLRSVLPDLTTHTEHEGGYCDTGEDMEWVCRSECVKLAEKRILTKIKNLGIEIKE